MLHVASFATISKQIKGVECSYCIVFLYRLYPMMLPGNTSQIGPGHQPDCAEQRCSLPIRPAQRCRCSPRLQLSRGVVLISSPPDEHIRPGGGKKDTSECPKPVSRLALQKGFLIVLGLSSERYLRTGGLHGVVCRTSQSSDET